jgi:NAD(P)-dependent dehydrogenase (short-subunit alcohol dehydrogenase family)
MSRELEGKVAVVTGGSSGIGARAAERLAGAGARVVIADIDEKAARGVVAGIGDAAAFHRTDVADQNQVRAMVDFAVAHFGGLHILVNNAGIGGIRHPRLIDDDFSDFHRVIDINLLGVMAGTRDAARHMKDHGGGSIINISSIGGLRPAPSNWTYHVSKSAVAMFSQCAAIDLGEYNVRVNCIAPGNIETTILAGSMANGLSGADRDELMARIREFIISRQPLKRQGTTDDLAEAILFFASDRSRYVTGTVLPVDGGMVAGAPPDQSASLRNLIAQYRKGRD